MNSHEERGGELGAVGERPEELLDPGRGEPAVVSDCAVRSGPHEKCVCGPQERRVRLTRTERGTAPRRGSALCSPPPPRRWESLPRPHPPRAWRP